MSHAGENKEQKTCLGDQRTCYLLTNIMSHAGENKEQKTCLRDQRTCFLLNNIILLSRSAKLSFHGILECLQKYSGKLSVDISVV